MQKKKSKHLHSTRQLNEAINQLEERKWKQSMSKKELAAASGVPERTIRFYISEGLLVKPLQRGRAARYTPHHLMVLQRIAELKSKGLALSKIQERVQDLNTLDPILDCLEEDYERAGRQSPEPCVVIDPDPSDSVIEIIPGEIWLGIQYESDWLLEGGNRSRLERLVGFIRDALQGGSSW